MANNINIGVGVTLDVKASGAVKSLNKAELATKKLAATEKKRAQAAKAVEGRLKTQRNALARQAGALRRTSDAMRTMNSASVLQNATMAIGSIAIAAVVAGLVALIAVTFKLVSAYAEFERGVIRANAVLQIQGRQAGKISSLVLKLGRTTVASFNDIAKSAEQLARAGLGVNVVMATMPKAINLAIAAGTGLTEATEIVIRTMFGFGIAISDMESALDTLAFVSIKANVTLQQLGQSMKFIAPVARVAGVDFEEVTAALGKMGNAGIQASLAGTTLRAAIARLVNPSRDAEVIMAQFGLQNEVVGGKITSLAKVIGRLNAKMASVADIFAIFGLRAGPGMAALLSVGQEALEEFTEEARNAQGVMKDLAARNMLSLQVRTEIMGKSFGALSISLGEAIARFTGLGTVLDLVAKGMGDVASMMNKANKATEEHANIIERLEKMDIAGAVGVPGASRTSDESRKFMLDILLANPDISEINKRTAKLINSIMTSFTGNLGATTPQAAFVRELLFRAIFLAEEDIRKAKEALNSIRVPYDKAKDALIAFTEAEISTVNPLIAANKAIRTQLSTVKAWVQGWKDVNDATLPIPQAQGVIIFMMENVDKKAAEMLETLGFIPPEFERLRKELHKDFDVFQLKNVSDALDKIKEASTFTPAVGSLKPAPLPDAPVLEPGGDVAQFNKDLIEHDELVKSLEKFPALAAPDRRTFTNMEAFTFLTRTYKALRDDLIVTGIPFSVPDAKDFKSMNALRFATQAYSEIVANIDLATIDFPVPDPDDFVSMEAYTFVLETQRDVIKNIGKIGFLPKPPDPKKFINDQAGLNEALQIYADLLELLKTQPFELTPPDISQFQGDLEGFAEAVRVFNAVKEAGEQLHIVFPVPTPQEFNTIEAFVEAYIRFFELIGQPLPVPVEELTAMAKAMNRVTEAIRIANAMTLRQHVAGQDSIVLLQETRQMMAALTDARNEATEAQRAQIDITMEALEAQEAELEILARKQVALQLFGTVIDSTVNSLLQMAKAGTFSFKAVAKAVANAVAAELAAMAIKNLVKGFEMLAIGFGLASNPATAALSKDAFISAKLHFKTAALAGAGAAGAAALGAGGGAGLGQNNTPITTGADLTGSPRTPTVTVIFEGGSNVLVEDREEFARTLAEQVIRAQADGVV